ncbi:helix-turn-helix transcriptional regulator [Phenylobacterium sp.]|uniref:helix-turn-helix domain-containing protein n=1 Tax=Phenylobacterium sp. TaxID=1871053 RepID=UPI002ED9E4F0
MDEPVEYVVGRRLRRRRRLMGLTQSELGVLCGVSFQQVQKYESAHTRLSVGMLWKLACALEVDVSYFFADVPRALPANEGRRLPAAETLASANAA